MKIIFNIRTDTHTHTQRQKDKQAQCMDRELDQSPETKVEPKMVLFWPQCLLVSVFENGGPNFYFPSQWTINEWKQLSGGRREREWKGWVDGWGNVSMLFT